MTKLLHYGDFKVKMAEYVGYQIRSQYAIDEEKGDVDERRQEMIDTYQLMIELVSGNCSHWKTYQKEKAHNEYIQSLDIPCEDAS